MDDHKAQSEVEKHMQALVERWELASNQQAVFLRCYWMMTENMLAAIKDGEFFDDDWVNKLLHHFASYYFAAQETYELNPGNAPPVWRIAFDATRNSSASVLHHLILGVNAHITYDLVLTLVDILTPEWAALSENQRQKRYADHSQVNTIIARTIDAVQDTVVEHAIPEMDIVDKILGPVDEWVISHLIAHWRDDVWQAAIRLIETGNADEQALLLQEIETRTMRRADTILGRKSLLALADLL